MGFLDNKGLSYFWGKVQAALAAKQDALKGRPGQVVGFDKSGSAAAVAIPEQDQGRSGENLLDNWCFANPINQRGQEVYTAGGYCIDRWYNRNCDSISIVDGGILITNTRGWVTGLNQRFEFPEELLDQDITCSVLVDENTMDGDTRLGLFDAATAGLNSGVLGPGTLISIASGETGFFSTSGHTNSIINNGGINAGLFFNRALGTIKVRAMKIELGIQQTLAHQDADGNWVLNDPPPNRALELAKCQRYFRALRPIESNGWAILGSGFNYNGSTKARILIPLSGQMAKRPTCSFFGKLALTTGKEGTNSKLWFQVADISLDTIALCGFDVIATVTTELTPGETYYLWIINPDNSNDGVLYIDANL